MQFLLRQRHFPFPDRVLDGVIRRRLETCAQQVDCARDKKGAIYLNFSAREPKLSATDGYLDYTLSSGNIPS
jgi:hypothetical protein